jgi:hypothetical protein
VHRSQPHQRQHQRFIPSQSIPPTPYPTPENDLYTTSANHGFSNISDNNLWPEIPSAFPPGHQFSVPTSMAQDMISNNDDLTRLLGSNYSIGDDATGMGFSSASSNNNNNNNNNGVDRRFRR